MTNEEAKRKVKGYLTDILPSDCSDEIDEIMKALEQTELNPSYNSIKTELDCISRTELIQKLNAWDSKAHGIPNYAWKVIREMPSVTPTSEDIKEAYLKGYDYGVKDWFKSKTQPTDMTLDEAIEDCEENDYGQIADWLRELKAYKEAQQTDADCISKVEAINRIEVRRKITCESDPYNYEEWTKGYEEGIDDAIAMINSVPSVTPERPKGKWIDGYCSECGKSCLCDGWGIDIESKYCPKCGAEMSGGEEE